VLERLETLAHGTPEEILLQSLERKQPCEVRDLVARSGLSRSQAQDSVRSLVREGQVLVLDGRSLPDQLPADVSESNFVISRSGWGALRERMTALLSDYHRQFPLRAGMPREEVKSRLARNLPDLSPRLYNDLVGRAIGEGWLAEAGGAISLASHQPAFTQKQQHRVDYLLFTFRQERYATPSVSQCEEQVGDEVLNALIEQGQLIKLNEDVVFLTETYEEMRRRIVDHLKEHGTITVAEVRDMFGTSRKYALALLGHLDERRITRRVGDERVLR
jgi:selenocysteine-specific elongation factor